MAKDVAVRLAKTFWQSAVAYLSATFSTQMSGVDVFDLHDIQSVFGSLLIGALAAGLSATWNGVVQPMFEKRGGM